MDVIEKQPESVLYQTAPGELSLSGERIQQQWYLEFKGSQFGHTDLSALLGKYLGLYCLCNNFFGLSYLLIKSYFNRLVEKNRRRFELLDREKEREIYHSKIEFFTNIAHEIRTPLTLIKMPLDKLMKKTK